MKTKIIAADDREGICQAAEIIRAGGLVAFPTETVYGLGANALDPEAVRRIYAVKGRPADNPSIAHISCTEEIKNLTGSVTKDMRILMKAFWPGPMTMITRRLSSVPDATTGGLDTVGIRMPDVRAARELIRLAGCPVAAPSANLSGRPSPTAAEHVLHDFDGKIEAVIDGGPCRVGIESTVIDMTEKVPMILRPGILTREDFQRVLQKPVDLDPYLNQRPDAARAASLKPKAPGMKYRHYAPKAEMILYEGDYDKICRAVDAEKKRREDAGQKVGVLLFREDQEEEAAHEFFARLREADREGCDVILAAALPEKGIGFSIMNRMLKSAGYNIRKV